MDVAAPPLLAARVERHFLATWRAMGEMDWDGWRVRISGGYSDRANAVTPLSPGQVPMADKVAWAEAFYAARHLPTQFRITDLYPDPGLDAWLQARGYKPSWKMETAALDLSIVDPAHDPRVEIADAPGGGWIDAALAVDAKIAPHLGPFAFMVGHVPRPRAFARVVVDGAPAAIGAAAVGAGLMGVFLMRTRAEHQRRGLARAALGSLLAWGKGQGARTAWLQFDKDRAAPSGLYRGAGFKPLYEYHYRRRAGG
jgi:GNAT superfamily N-acetyltransferase